MGVTDMVAAARDKATGAYKDAKDKAGEHVVAALGRNSKRQGLYKKHLLDGTLWWGGSFTQDAWRNFKNAHPFFSIFFAHAKHPLSRRERFIILTFSLMLRLFVAGVLAILQDSGLDTKSFAGQFVAGIIVAVISTLCLSILNFCATCDDRFFGSTQGGILRSCGSCLGASFLWFSWCIMLCFGLAGVLLVALSESASLGNYFYVTGLSLLQSWLLVWPLLSGGILFAYGRHKQMRSDGEQEEHPVDNISLAELQWWETHDFPPDADTDAVVSAAGEDIPAGAVAPAPPMEEEGEGEEGQAAHNAP